MPTDEMLTMELLEQCEKAAYEKLKEIGFDDPNRGKILNEAKTYADIRVAYEETEQARLNNNAKNDLEEAKLVIEQMKLKNDKARMRLDFGGKGMFVLAAIFSGVTSYMLDDVFQDYKPLTRLKDQFLALVTKK